MAPFGGGRGTDVVFEEGRGEVLEAGTESVVWKMLKQLPCGPKGEKEVVWVSEAMIEVPLASWPVATTRGAMRPLL